MSEDPTTSEQSERAMCALHTTTWAILACERCGHFACAACLVDPRTSTICRTCTLAQPRESAWAASGRIVRATLWTPHRFFKDLPEGSLRQAFGLALLAHCSSRVVYQLLWGGPEESVLDAFVMGLGTSTEVWLSALAVYLLGRMTTPLSLLRTARCLSYAHIPTVIGILPWTKKPAMIWCAWLSIYGLRHSLQRSWLFAVVGLSLTMVLGEGLALLADVAEHIFAPEHFASPTP